MVVREVNHKELREIIKKDFRCKIPHFVAGGTGIGKSQVVRDTSRELAGENKRKFVIWNKLTLQEKHEVADNPEKYFFMMDIRLSQFDPSDLRGLPALNGKDVVEWKIPFWLFTASKKGAMGIIFFDEINLAPPSLQASAYQVIHDRELGEVPLSEDVVCIGAGNRLEDKANIYDLPRPLQNRFTHTTLKPPHINGQECKDDWVEWAMNNDIDMRIVTFLMQSPSLLNPKIDNDSNERAFPTPRSWEICSKLIKGEESLDWIEALASTAVGSAAAGQLVAQIKFSRKINLKEILDDPTKAKKITELDMKFSLLALVSEWYAVNHTKNDLETVLQIVDVIQPEFAILLLRYAKLRHKQQFMTTVTSLKSWKSVSGKYQKFVV